MASAANGSALELVGRGRERIALTTFLGEIASGPAALVIEGEPGIGKTCLFDTGLAAAQGRAVTLRCRPTQSEIRLGYSGLNDLLEPVIDRVLPRLPRPQSRALEAALVRIGAAESPGPQAVPFAMLGVLRALAQQAPVLIAVDDIQWLDADSCSVLTFALRRLRSECVGLLATIRGDSHDRLRRDLLKAIPDQRAHCMRLGPLSIGELHHVLQRHLSTPVPRSTLVRLSEASGGNPYFAIQLASALERVDPRLGPGQPLPVPARLSELLEHRLARLPVRARETVLFTAVLARPTTELVTMAMEDEASAALDLERAIAAGILQNQTGQLKFSHPLLSSAVYEHALPRSRRAAHARAARTVADPEQRARHLALAHAGGPDASVANALDGAAEAARSRGAPAAAAQLLDLAIELTPMDQPRAIHRRRVDAGVLHLQAGEATEALPLLETAVAGANPGSERAEARWRLGGVHCFADDWQVAGELFSLALREVPPDSPLRTRIALDLAFSSHVLGNIPLAFEQASAALEMAENTRDDGLRAVAQACAASLSFLVGNGLNVELLEKAVASEQRTTTAWPWAPGEAAGTVYKFADQFDRARALLERASVYYREHGEENGLPMVLCQLAELECWAGNWDAAERYSAQADEITLLSGMQAQRVLSLYAQALVYAHRGRLDEAEAVAMQSRDLARRAGNHPVSQQAVTVLGFVELSRDRPSAAHAYLDPLARAVAREGLGDPGVLRFVPDEIEALVSLGELEQAERLLGPFDDRAVRLQRKWALATGARCRALIACAKGDVGAACEVIDRALCWHEGLPIPFELGRTLLVKGVIERRTRQKQASRISLERARAIFDYLGAVVWSQKSQRELARIGGRPASPESLTAAEQRVGELAALGYSNRQIADRLFISVNTVQTTLRHVFQKLELESRTELALRMRAIADAKITDSGGSSHSASD